VIMLPYRVVLDSNFLILPLTLRLDIFSEIERLLPGRVEFLVVSSVRKELEKLSSKKTEIGRRATFALELLDRCIYVNLDLEQRTTVDEALVDFARKKKVIVATSDMPLRKKLRDINVPVIYVRDYSRLELEGFPIKNGD
jgi:rRNA-processing protein FCF1